MIGGYRQIAPLEQTPTPLPGPLDAAKGETNPTPLKKTPHARGVICL